MSVQERLQLDVPRAIWCPGLHCPRRCNAQDCVCAPCFCARCKARMRRACGAHPGVVFSSSSSRPITGSQRRLFTTT